MNSQAIIALVLCIEIYTSIVSLLWMCFLQRYKGIVFAASCAMRLFTYGALLIQWETGQAVTVGSGEAFTMLAGSALGLYLSIAIMDYVVTAMQDDQIGINGRADVLRNVKQLYSERAIIWGRLKAGRWILLKRLGLSVAIVLICYGITLRAYDRFVVSPSTDLALGYGISIQEWGYIGFLFWLASAIWFVAVEGDRLGSLITRIALDKPEPPKPTDGWLTKMLRGKRKAEQVS